MYLCFLAMGCFIAFMGVNVIPWVTLDIYYYFRKRRIEKKIKIFKRKRGFSEKIKGKETSAGKSRWTYTDTNCLGSLFVQCLVIFAKTVKLDARILYTGSDINNECVSRNSCV